jgi:hypothetical protein
LFVFDILLRGFIFLLPGVGLTLIEQRRRTLEPLQFAAVTLVNSALVAYVVFWPYLVSARFGKAISLFVALGTVAVIVREFLARRIEIVRLRELGVCALLMTLVAIAYSAIGHLYHYSSDPVIQAQQRFVDLPPDNFIPYVFAGRLYHSVPVRPWLFGEWKSSDRPPLAVGATLFQIPLWKEQQRVIHYQNLGVFLQSMWIAALWIVLKSAQVPRRVIAVTCAFCVASPAFLLFTFFIWPKFLAAGLFIICLYFLRVVQRETTKCTSFDIAFAGTALALGFLSHPGVAFTAIGLAVFLLIRRTLPPFQRSLGGVVLLLVLVAPWILYQKFYDPPGDRLIKWHLAGVREIDSRSFPRALMDAYTTTPPRQIIQAKISNFETLWGRGPIGSASHMLVQKNGLDAKQLLAEYVNSNFFYVLQATGVLNAGFLVLLFLPMYLKKIKQNAALDGAISLLVLSLLSLIVWCLMMFGPSGTLLHEGSLATFILLDVALAAILTIIAPKLSYVLLALQIFLLFPLYVVARPFLAGGGAAVRKGADQAMAIVTFASLGILALLAWRFVSCERPRPAERALTSHVAQK